MFMHLLFSCGLLLAATSAMAMTIYKSTDANGVVSYSDRPSPGAQVFVFRDRMVEHLERQVRLDVEKSWGWTASLCVTTCMRRWRSSWGLPA